MMLVKYKKKRITLVIIKYTNTKSQYYEEFDKIYKKKKKEKYVMMLVKYEKKRITLVILKKGKVNIIK